MTKNLFGRLGVLFLVLGVIAVAAVGWTLRPDRHAGWVETTGTVIGHEEHRSYDREDRRWETHWSLVVTITDEAGQEHTVTSNIRTNRPKPIGATVDVRYPPGQIDRAQVGWDAWFWTIFLGIWAVVLLFLGVIFLFVVGRAIARTPGRASASGKRASEDTHKPAIEDR
ncbi:MAG: DUF3592 domain-containing protein, partial [Propionibacteriaceae bacterium]|nr:DUF3592 domain-containing protein [Propionibacteriaceae bacterium]